MLTIIFNGCVYIWSWKNSKQPQEANKPHPKNNLRDNGENTESDPGGPECGKVDSADRKIHKFALIKSMLIYGALISERVRGGRTYCSQTAIKITAIY